MASDWKNNVLLAFDKGAKTYAGWSWIQSQIAVCLADDLPSLPEKSDILEIGCGSGLFTKQLVNVYQTQNLHVTDVSPEMLKCARSNVVCDRVTWSILDGEMQKTGKTYDLIVANMVFQWFENLQSGLMNLKTMLKETGTLLFNIPGPNTLLEWRKVLDELHFPCALLDFCLPLHGIYRRRVFEENFKDAYSFLKSLKNTGTTCGRSDIRPLSPAEIRMACRTLDSKGITSFSWDILFVRLGCQERPL